LTPTNTDNCDVLVLGSGPAARAIAALLAAPGEDYDILLADANYDRKWIPNYGVWQYEWQSIKDLYASFQQPIGSTCIDRLWEVADCFFGGSFDIPVENRMRIDRPYCRVDRNALRRTLSPKSEVDVENEGEGNARYRVYPRQAL
jgi:lycopene beta-cyclase